MMYNLKVLFFKFIGKFYKSNNEKILLGRWNLKHDHMKYYENKDYPY